MDLNDIGNTPKDPLYFGDQNKEAIDMLSSLVNSGEYDIEDILFSELNPNTRYILIEKSFHTPIPFELDVNGMSEKIYYVDIVLNPIVKSIAVDFTLNLPDELKNE